jgi:hypothetical protein
MSLTVSLWSKKEGEIRKFLEKYYESEIFLDDDVDQWCYVYKKPLESVDIISALMDNYHKYDIALGIQVNEGDVYTVTEENHNDVIKGIFVLFYDELQAQY